MAFAAQVKFIAENKSLTVELPGGNRLTNVATLFSYDPVPQEMAIIVGLESGGYLAIGSSYNLPDLATRNSG